jgi:esterase/lipase superfamily enzyme
MNREYHRWYSPALNRDMELLVYGHAGARVLVFPTSQGRFYEWEDRGVMVALREQIDNGWLQFYLVDSVDAESWYCGWAHPSGRAYRHSQYDGYLYHEVLPFMHSKNNNPYLMTLGASFGAYHAMNFGLKHANQVNRILGFHGLYDIRWFVGGYNDANVYWNNPLQFVWDINDPIWLDQLYRQDIIIVAGTEDRLVESSRAMSRALWSRGIGNALREWNGWYHDWPHWIDMLRMYIGGHD